MLCITITLAITAMQWNQSRQCVSSPISSCQSLLFALIHFCFLSYLPSTICFFSSGPTCPSPLYTSAFLLFQILFCAGSCHFHWPVKGPYYPRTEFPISLPMTSRFACCIPQTLIWKDVDSRTQFDNCTCSIKSYEMHVTLLLQLHNGIIFWACVSSFMAVKLYSFSPFKDGMPVQEI